MGRRPPSLTQPGALFLLFLPSHSIFRPQIRKLRAISGLSSVDSADLVGRTSSYGHVFLGFIMTHIYHIFRMFQVGSARRVLLGSQCNHLTFPYLHDSHASYPICRPLIWKRRAISRSSSVDSADLVGRTLSCGHVCLGTFRWLIMVPPRWDVG